MQGCGDLADENRAISYRLSPPPCHVDATCIIIHGQEEMENGKVRHVAHFSKQFEIQIRHESNRSVESAGRRSLFESFHMETQRKWQCKGHVVDDRCGEQVILVRSKLC